MEVFAGHSNCHWRSLLWCVLLLSGAGSCAGQLPNITTTALPSGTTGGAYSALLNVAGGAPPYSNWTVGAGALPPGLTLNTSIGSISGTPAASGTFTFFITVQDSTGAISPAAGFTITTSVPVITTTSAVMASGAVGTVYSFGMTATGGTAPYANWMLTSGSLPQGLFLNPATGVLSGTPIAVGAYVFSVTVQDALGVTSAPVSLTLVTGVAIITTSLPKGTVTGAYTAQLAAGGGTPPYAAWTISAGGLPPGLMLDPTAGLVSGIPSTAGSYSFSVTTTDSTGVLSALQPFTVVIANTPTVVTGALLPGLPGVVYSATLAASEGTAPLVWSIANGTLPPGLALTAGTGVISGTPQSAAGTTFSFSVQVTDAVGMVSPVQPLSIAITQASLTISPASLSFNATPGDTTPIPVQSVAIFSLSSTVTFNATVATTSGGNWLSVAGGGRTPRSLLVSVNANGLAPNATYHGTITVSGQNITSSTIPVSLTMGPSVSPQLSVSPASMALNYVQGNGVDQRYLIVRNTGGGTIHFSAQATTSSCGASWLNLLTTNGSATPASPGVIVVMVNPAGLAEKPCAGNITIQDSGTGQSQNIAVTMSVSAQTQSLLLTQSGMSFQAGVGSSPPPQSFSVLNTGVGTVNWTATAQTANGGNWLVVTPSSGAATMGVVPTPVILSVSSAGLPPGQYSGSVQVSSNAVGNSLQTLTVVLSIVNGPPPPPPMTPSGVILVGQTTGTSEPETVTLFNPWSTPISYNSTIVTDNRGNWLTQSPAAGTIAAGGTSSMILQASTKGLATGLQHGAVRTVFPDGTVHAVDVYLIIPASGVAASVRNVAELEAPVGQQAIAQACPGGAGIAVVLRSPEPGFQVTAQVPVPIQLVAKDCATGKVIRRASGASAQVVPDLSAPILLTDDGAGNWSGTWTPTSAAALFNLTARIDQYIGSTASVVSSQETITGTVNAAPDPSVQAATPAQ